MNQTEQKQFDELREQLASAEATADHIKAHSSHAVTSLKNEVRLYRGLFWCMLAFGVVVAILTVLQR